MFIKFEELQEADLIVNTVYKSGNKGNYSDEALSKLMKCENSCGFRKRGSLKESKLKYVVLYSNGEHENWKDTLDIETGEFIYYGDQNKVNKEIHDTPKKGNEVLRRTFELLEKGERHNIAPFFIFTKQQKRDVIFRGIAVPGCVNRNIKECLEIVTIKKTEGEIQNYRAIFTILNVKKISRKWLDDLDNGNGLLSEEAPPEWKSWIENVNYKNLCFEEIKKSISQNASGLIDEDNVTKNVDEEELDILLNSIDEIAFKLTYKLTDNRKKSNLEDESKASNKKKCSKPKKLENYIEEYKKKQIVGFIGECIILKREKERLKNSEEIELVKKVNDIEWSSKEIGDGLGYDIRSYDIKHGKIIDKYIEVKTTLGKDEGFEITTNEVEKSNNLNKEGIYAIARVYNLDIKNKTADFYFKEGCLKDNYNLETSIYIAHRK